MTTTNTMSLIAKVIRWFARIYSLLIFIVAAIVAANPVPLLNRPLILIDWLTLLLFPGVPLIGLLLAWRWEALGGVTTFTSWLFHFFVKKFTTGIWFVDFGEVILWFFAFALPSLLFLISWALSRSQPKIIKKDKTKNEAKNYHNINSEIKASANYAIQITKEKLSASLNYDENSLQTLEGLLDKAFQSFSELSKQGKLQEKAIQQNTKIWGGYLGELIRHKFGGEWHKTDETYILQIGGISLYPHAFVQQRITINSSYGVVQYYTDVSNQISIFNESSLTSTPIESLPRNSQLHQADMPVSEKSSSAEKKMKPEEYKNLTRPQNSSFNTIALGVLIFCLLSVVVFSLLKQSAPRQNYQAPPIPTTDPQEQIALKAVQNQNTILASNMHESIAVILVILENDGHTQSIDGWYVSKESDYYSVSFYFYLDGNREYAEWWYYPSTELITPKNDWAFTFMGE